MAELRRLAVVAENPARLAECYRGAPAIGEFLYHGLRHERGGAHGSLVDFRLRWVS